MILYNLIKPLAKEVLYMEKEKLLKNCPFCGEEADVAETFDGKFIVMCCLCGCKTCGYKYQEQAIRIWNRRISNTHGNKRK